MWSQAEEQQRIDKNEAKAKVERLRLAQKPQRVDRDGSTPVRHSQTKTAAKEREKESKK